MQKPAGVFEHNICRLFLSLSTLYLKKLDIVKHEFKK